MLICILFPQKLFAGDQVTLGTNIGLGIIPLVAENEGYFKEEGLDVKIKELNVAKVVMDALSSGDIDFGTTLESNLSFFGFNENNYKIVVSLGERTGDAIYFKKQSGISGALDLKGKKIAYVPGTASQIFLGRLLNQNGLNWTDITPVSIQPQLGRLVLRNDSVDALSLWHTFGYYIKKESGETVDTIESSASIYPGQIFLASTDKVLNGYKQKAVHLSNALKKAAKLLKENPKKTYPYLAKRFNLEESEMPIFLSGYNFERQNRDKCLTLLKENGGWIKHNVESFHNLPLPDYEKYFLDLFDQ